jgi:RNA polymerase sigma factor (sigma-70 family)
MIYQAVLNTQPDGKLATLAAAGSEPAFEAIVHRYRRPLMGYCRRLRLSDNRSEDVVQQTFMNAWGSLRQGAEVRELRPWLYRITHNQAVSMLRAYGRDDTSLNELQGGPLGSGGDEFESTASVEVVYERRTRLREALTAVAELPALQREALLATAVDGLSYDEVAAALNTTGDAVRGLVYRARNSLRAGVAVLSPSPLVVWAANHTGQAISVENVGQWLTEASLGGGSVGLSAIAVKSAVVIASSAAVVGGTVGTGLEKQVFGSGAHRSGHSSARSGSTETSHFGAASGKPATSGTGHTLGHGGVATASVTGGRAADRTPAGGNSATGRSTIASRHSQTTTQTAQNSSSTPPLSSSAGQSPARSGAGSPAAAGAAPLASPVIPGAAALRPADQTNGQMQPGGTGQSQAQSPPWGTGGEMADHSGGGTATQSGSSTAGQSSTGSGGTRPVVNGQPFGSGENGSGGATSTTSQTSTTSTTSTPSAASTPTTPTTSTTPTAPTTSTTPTT